MTARILHTADLQIGRQPSRLPPHVKASPSRVWEHIVRYAIEYQVDAVTLGGDIVDEENRFYEAYGPLERGIRALSQAGIPVIAVVGNHDVEVFPRLADSLDNELFILLGRDGSWERHTIEPHGRPVLHIDGWSFPTEKVHEDPVADYSLPTPKDAPVVGLVHGDLDKSQSDYAPLSKNRMLQQDVAAWLLGHWHKPMKIQQASGPLILYPGSPQGLDPGEPGVHGPWLLTFNEHGLEDVRLVPMASAVYESIGIDLTGVTDPGDLQKRLVATILDHLAATLKTNPRHLEHVVYRPVYKGRTRLHGELPALLARQEDLGIERDGVTTSIDKPTIKTTPDLDLDDQQHGHGPTSTLAGLLLDLERDGDAEPLSKELLAEAEEIVAGLLSSPNYQQLRGDRPLEEGLDARQILRDKGLLLLDALRAQKESREAEA